MKWPKTFPTRAAANEKAAELRRTYVGVLVYRTGDGFGVAYAKQQPRAALPPNKRKVKK